MKKSVWFLIEKFLILWALFLTVFAEKYTRGPYEMTLDRLKNCSKTYRPLSHTDIIKLNVSQSENGMLSGEMIVKKNNIRYLKFRTDTYLWEDGEWILMKRVPGWTCDRKFLVVMLTALGVKYDKKTCTLKEGIYSFKNIDVNTLSHVWISNLVYGKLMARAEFIDNKNTYVCLEFELSVNLL